MGTRSGKILGRIALAVVLASMLTVAACQNEQIGFGGFVGNTPNTSPETIFKVLGTIGTPFTLLISNARSSWQVQGNIPLNITIINNVNVGANTPGRMIATKLASDNSLMSLEIMSGFTVITAASTTQPYGNVTITTGTPLPESPPLVTNDVRVFVAGPFSERFTGFIEDSQVGFEFQQRVPALYLFDLPNGKVDATFIQIQDFGPFKVNMTLNGKLIATASGEPNVTIREP